MGAQGKEKLDKNQEQSVELNYDANNNKINCAKDIFISCDVGRVQNVCHREEKWVSGGGI